jgi:glycosyltransferase involved in cell wall biosynthesis
MYSKASLISIIIPTYNRAHLISETLDSVLGQTYTNWECLIVDDGSTDDTKEVVRKYVDKDNRFQYHTRPIKKRKGPNSCRNYGFEQSKGAYVKWFDSDDLYFLNTLESYVGCFTENIDVVIGKLEKIDFKSGNKLGENSILSDNMIEDYFTGKIAFYVCGPLWKRSFLEKQEELFDETISNLDDWDFNLRMLYQNPIIVYIDEPLIQYRIHENSLSNEINKLNFEEIKSEFQAREKHLKLIVKNKQANPRILQNFIEDRNAFFFREAMVQNHDRKKYFFIKRLSYQFKSIDFYGFIKTVFGYLIYSFFNKGYKLLK